MSDTKRNIPKWRWLRKPKFRWKLLAGLSRKKIVTDWDDQGIAGRSEMKHTQP